MGQERDLRFSIFQNRFDKMSKPAAGTWEYWVDQLSQPLVTDNKDNLSIILGHIPAGETHANDLVESVEAVGLDLDNITEDQLMAVCENLAPFEYVLYSSHSHNPPDSLKLRVIMPLGEPISPDQHIDYWNAINALANNLSDPQTKNVARLFYIHACPEDRQEHALFFRNEGRWFGEADRGTPSFNVSGLRDEGTEARSSNAPANAPAVVAAPSTLALPAALPAAPASTMLLTPDLLLEEGRRRSRRSGSNDKMVGQLLKALAKGKPFASKGSRENARFLLCQTIFETWPNSSLEAACELFRPSLTAMHEAEPLKQGVNGTLKEIRYKLGRAQAKVLVLEKQREDRRRDTEARINFEARGDGKDTAYSDEDLQHIADMQGCQPYELVARWVCYKDGTAYFLNMKGYQGPFGKNDVRSVAATFLHPVQNITAYNPPMQRGGQRTLKGYS